MNLLVSPYHVTSRELPMMAGALLGGRLVTYLPTPTRVDRAGVRAALHASPRYLRLLESWRWAAPLFREGVVASLDERAVGEDDGDAAGRVRSAAERMEGEEAVSELRPYCHAEVYKDETSFLEGVSGDVLKGGPDPGVSVPMAAGLDAFARAHGLMALRSGEAGFVRTPGAPSRRSGAPGASVVMTSSLAQRAESALGRTVFSVAAPVMLESSAMTILELREELSQDLDVLRGAVDEAVKMDRQENAAGAGLAGAGGAARGSKGDSAMISGPVRQAASEYARAFAVATKGMDGRDDDSGRRMVVGQAMIVCRALPADAAFISSVAAIRQAKARFAGTGGAGMGGTGKTGSRGVGGGTSVGVRDAATARGETLYTLWISAFNARSISSGG